MLPSSAYAFGFLLLLHFFSSTARVARCSPTIAPSSFDPNGDDDNIFLFDLDDEHFSTSSPSTNTGFVENDSEEESEPVSRTQSQSLRYPEIPFLSHRPITCPGPPPPEGLSLNDMLYPTGLRAGSYDSLRQLCWNTKDGRPPGLGCGCANPGRSTEVTCQGMYNRGDPRLLRTAALGICESSCQCPLEYSADDPGHIPIRAPSFSGRNAAFQPRMGAYSLPGFKEASRQATMLQKSRSSGSNLGGRTTCGATCHSNRYCSAGGRDSTCGRCVMKETVNPLDRSRPAFLALCMTLGGLSGKRKRSLDAAAGEEAVFEPACACNSTYISKACCSEDGSGLVWEAPELRLGVVLDEV